MSTILDTIIEHKKEQVRELRSQKSVFRAEKVSARGFIKVLQESKTLSVIAEVKKASPSKGVICQNFDPIAIAQKYEKSGAAAISVLTDEKFFQGNIDYLRIVRDNVSIPVLRKEFIIDILQVEQTAHVGADAMLLIAAALDDYQMKDLYQAAQDLGIDALIEVHNEHELDRVMKLSPQLIGINNRDLKTFITDIKVTLELIKRIPPEIVIVSESGIESQSQAQQLKQAGVRALLVGESLIKSPDTEKLLKELTI